MGSNPQKLLNRFVHQFLQLIITVSPLQGYEEQMSDTFHAHAVVRTGPLKVLQTLVIFLTHQLPSC